MLGDVKVSVAGEAVSPDAVPVTLTGVVSDAQLDDAPLVIATEKLGVPNDHATVAVTDVVWPTSIVSVGDSPMVTPATAVETVTGVGPTKAVLGVGVSESATQA